MIAVKLVGVERESGNTVADINRIDKEYKVHSAVVGARAILIEDENKGRALHTSTVERVSIYDGFLRIKTRNTEYYFEIV